MKNALEHITNLAAEEVSPWMDEAAERNNNSQWAKRSFKIAVRILREIRTQKPINGMTQKRLAEEMNVSPQYINKIMKGKENLTLETISKIESVLGITLLEIPSYDLSQTIALEQTQTLIALRRSNSVSISESVCSYNNQTYYEATGTNG